MPETAVPVTTSPLLGEHNEEIYGKLGYTPAQIAELRKEKAI